MECYCNHLTGFAGGWVVAPNTIDFKTLDFDPTKSPVIYVTLAVIIGKYLSIPVHLSVWYAMFNFISEERSEENPKNVSNFGFCE